MADIIPLADGGEGTVDAIADANAGRWYSVEQLGVHGRKTTVWWYAVDGGPAIVESASVLGLPLIGTLPDELSVGQRSSGALGHLITGILDTGIRDIVIGLGGSCTNDAGFGLLASLGARAFDDRNRPIEPSMHCLMAIDRLDLSGIDARLRECRIRVLCDVDNPLTGAYGATRTYGKQKGVPDSQISAIDVAIRRFALMSGSFELAEVAGSGAAGGLGFAFALLGGRLESGAKAVLDLVGFKQRLAEADLIITGEGRSDRQTLHGKLPMAVALAARPIPAILVSGAIEAGAEQEFQKHFARQYSLVETAGSLSSALAEPERWLSAIGGLMLASDSEIERLDLSWN